MLLEVFLKICSKFTGEHPCRSVILLKLHFDMGVSPVNLLHIFSTTFPQTSKDVSQLTPVVVRRHVGVETKPCIYWVAVVLATTLSNKRWFLRHFTIHLSLIIKLVTVNIKVCSIGLERTNYYIFNLKLCCYF